MGKFFSKRSLLMAFTLGIFGKNMVWADDCAIFQTAMQTVDKDKYGNIGNCCSTNMVTCENNTITKIKIEELHCGKNNDLEYLITQFAQLSNLKTFEFISGHFCDMPQNFSELQQIKELVYSKNRVSISLPENVSKLTNLEKLDFSENAHNGEIPKSYCEMKNLKILKLNNNYLSGEIPVEMGNMKNLEVLELGNNQLTGYIPYSFENLENLTHFTLNDNDVRGYIPIFPNIKTCDFGWFNICMFESTPCKTNISQLNKCKKEDVEATNKGNHNPNPDDAKKYEKLLGTKITKIIRFIVIGIIVSILLCCMVCWGGLYYYHRHSKSKIKKPYKPNQTIFIPLPETTVNNNNYNKNNSNHDESDGPLFKIKINDNNDNKINEKNKINNNDNTSNEPNVDHNLYNKTFEKITLTTVETGVVSTDANDLSLPQPILVPTPVDYSQTYTVPLIQPAEYYPPPETQTYVVPQVQSGAYPSYPPPSAYSSYTPPETYPQYSSQPIYVQPPSFEYSSFHTQPPTASSNPPAPSAPPVSN